MLEATSTTDTEVLAARSHTILRCLEHAGDLSFTSPVVFSEGTDTAERRLFGVKLGTVTVTGGADVEVFIDMLVEGDSSRLHRLLVEEEQLALSVGSLQSDGFDPGLVYFYLTLPPGGDIAAAEERLYAELRRVATEGVTDAELEKARNLRLASFWRSLQTIDGKASALGNFETFTGDHENLFAVPERLAATTPDELRTAAAKVFRRNNMTTGILRAPPEDDAE